MLSHLATVLAGLLALAIILMGSRYLVDPNPAAAGFGIPATLGDASESASWLAVKGVRDIAVGIAIAALLIDGAHQQLAYLMAAAALIPIADGVIVLRAGGPRGIAYGVHWTTAAVMVGVAALLVV